jgi:hypothetical protein
MTEATEPTEKTHWTSWKRLGTWPYYTQQGISSPCDATMPEGFGPETSRWGTWCFGYNKTPEGATSSRLPWNIRQLRRFYPLDVFKSFIYLVYIHK